MTIKLMQGDCLEMMKEVPDGSVDMILTDPPYGMDFQSNYRNEKHKKLLNDIHVDIWLNEFTNEIFRIAANNSAHYVFCSFHNIDLFKQSLQRLFKIKNILTWDGFGSSTLSVFVLLIVFKGFADNLN